MSQFAGQPQFSGGTSPNLVKARAEINTLLSQNTGIAGGIMTLNSELQTAIKDGTLNQEQANKIAQQYYIRKNTPMPPNVRMANPKILLDHLKKSGYEYDEVPKENITNGTKAMPRPAYGRAVKISSGESGKPLGETTDTTSATAPTEEGFFAKNKTAIIVVGAFAVAGAAYYFYTQKKK